MAKIRYGLSNCYYAPITTTGNTETYGTPVALPGAVSLTLEASGDTIDEYADNITWFHMDVNNGYSGTFECEVLGDDFKTAILGETADTNNVLWENSDAGVTEFALLGQFEIGGDSTVTGKRFCFLRCTASRPANNGSTKEATITPQHDTLNITCMPRISDHYVKCSCESTSASYAGWFSAVPTHE